MCHELSAGLIKKITTVFLTYAYGSLPLMLPTSQLPEKNIRMHNIISAVLPEKILTPSSYVPIRLPPPLPPR